MSTSGSAIWQPDASPTETTTSVKDRISLFETTNNNKAGSAKTRNLATSAHHYRRWSSSGSINLAPDREQSSTGHRHHRNSSVVHCFTEEQEEEEVLDFEEMIACQNIPRLSRGNPEQNYRLQLKADELERLFAEHQRRFHENRETTTKHVVVEERPAEEKDGESSSSGVRGKQYDRYMERRYARRREDTGRNREEKQGKMKAMWESVERSRAEMMAWYERQELSSVDDRGRAGKLSSDDDDDDEGISALRKNDQMTVASVLAEDEEDMRSSDGSLKSVNSKMLTSRSASSSASRTSGFTVPKPSKVPASRSLRGSAPTPDFRKENRKPSTGTSKTIADVQPISVARSKSTSAGPTRFKEEKPPRSTSLRKISAPPLASSRTTKEQSVSKPSLKKGTGTTGAGLSKLKTSTTSDRNRDYFESLATPRNFSSVDLGASLDSPTGSASSLYSADGTRIRKKWGSAQIPFFVSDSSYQSQKDAPKGLKRFLHFGKKNRGVEGRLADIASVSGVSGSDYDMAVGRDLVSEQIRISGTGDLLDSYDGFSFSEGMNRPQQVQTPRRSIPTPASLKLQKDHLSGGSPRSPRSFFSLSAFRNKGVESKLR